MSRIVARPITCALVSMAFATTAWAQDLSTSVTSPSPLSANGVISGSYPTGDRETAYYVALDLKAGELATQIAFLGRPGRDKKLEFELLGANGRAVHSYWIMNGLDANDEAARVFPIDSSGRYTARILLKGPETTTFRVDLGGSALPQVPVPAAAGPVSNSMLNAAPLPKTSVITGTFPGGEKKNTYHYYAVDLKAGDLITQISFAGRANAPKMLELHLLKSNGRKAESQYIMSDLSANQEGTKSFPVDNSGRYYLRVVTKGAEGTRYKIEVGGSALPAAR